MDLNFFLSHFISFEHEYVLICRRQQKTFAFYNAHLIQREITSKSRSAVNTVLKHLTINKKGLHTGSQLQRDVIGGYVKSP